jgi:hypothetical protein
MICLKNGIADNNLITKEILWGQIFNQTIINSEWFDMPLSPGRMAVGYPFLYVAYRILNDIKPNNILELGLGQSSKLTCSYTKYFGGVSHKVVEHDEEWKDFFVNSNKELFNGCGSEIIITPLENVTYKKNKVIRYKNFKKVVAGTSDKFDFILIDGPFDSKTGFNRIDVLELIPQNLSDSFCILIDDCERTGELAMIEEIKLMLRNNNIEYSMGWYLGCKDVIIITSLDLKFMCSL